MEVAEFADILNDAHFALFLAVHQESRPIRSGFFAICTGNNDRNIGCNRLAAIVCRRNGSLRVGKILAGAEKKYGHGARQRLLSWTRLIAENRSKTEMQKLTIVNDFFNRIRYVSDLQHWGVQDYWATPVETLASNGADCEDFAIAKYYTLVAMGVDLGKLKITYVKATSYNPINQSHMVLTYYSTPNAVPLVLDNLINAIKPATQRSDLTPVYAFNGQGLWLAKARSLGRVSSGPGNIRPWRELRARMGKEF